ncbi:MAG: hypothetical protein KatS3mg052_1737 [Candidatus Roseilinea sp.]|nr:MAG: hypothetical protein KatS3mg052_1737 [Candidatus Roseilinea sp.]
MTKKAVNGVDIAGYAYDATWWTSGAHPVGRRTIAQVLNGATGTNTWTRWEYDARGRVKKETRSVDGVPGTFDVQFAYDSADRMTSMIYPNGEVVTTGYDDAMRPRSLSGASVYVSNATYNALGLLTRMDHGNGARTQRYHYGSDLEYPNAGNTSYGRLRRLCVATSSGNCDDESSAAGALLKLVYAYDAVGNLRFSGDRTTGERLAYSYDDLDRLTGVVPQVGWPGYSESYSYDAIGRMTFKTGVCGGALSYQHPGKPHALTHCDWGVIASYDANGNMVSRWDNGAWYTQEWNADNQVTRVYGNGQDVRYFYDADGALVRKTHNGQTTIYVGPHAEWNSSTGWTNYYYFNGQRGLPSAWRVAMRNGGGVFWLHGDHLGSASLVTNASGGVVSQSRYTPYGSARQVSGTWPTDRRFTGQRLEGSVGLYDYNARYYSPLLARFLSPDSIVPNPANRQDFNRYAYVRNNPLRYTDPTGHQADEVCQVLSCLSNEQKAQLQRRLESTRLGRAMFDKLRAKEVDLMQQVTIAILPQARGGISLPLASGHFGGDVHWQAKGSGHLIIVPPSANERDRLADANWVALVGHELFHAFQREVAHELPEHAHRDREFTTKQFEREAYIFQYQVKQELGGRLESYEQAMLEALTSDAATARNHFNRDDSLPVYRQARDDLHSVAWQEAMHALFKPPRIK